MYDDGLKVNHDIEHGPGESHLGHPKFGILEWIVNRKVWRKCRLEYGHCYHPIGYAVDWQCCMCLRYQDGMPDNNCIVCKEVQ